MAANIRKKRFFVGIVSMFLFLLLLPHVVQTTEQQLVIKPGDKKGTIDIASFTNIIEECPNRILLIDVRAPEEFAGGSLKTAINIPIDDLEDAVDSLPADKPIVYVCATGERSAEAYDITVLLRDDLRVYYLNALLTIDKAGNYKIDPIEP